MAPYGLSHPYRAPHHFLYGVISPNAKGVCYVRMFKRTRVAAVVAIAAAVVVLGGAGVAVAAATGKAGGTVTRVSVRTENAPTVFTGGVFQQVGTTSVYAGAGSFIVATFSAESACYGGSGWCSVRILIDGAEAEPTGGTDFAFDSTNGTNETSGSWESHSMQRTLSVAASGSHTVAVQMAQVGAGVTSRYDDWTLTAYAVTP